MIDVEAPAAPDASYCAGGWYAGCGTCACCGVELVLEPGRSRWFCGKACSKRWRLNHWWTEARRAALKRDRHCVKCGGWKRLEVNHIEPLVGAGYATSCAHHAENLEVLCRSCHQGVTKDQAAARRAEGAEFAA